MDYGKLLKQERIKSGMSQYKLADKAGVTQRSIAYWESGQKKMTMESAGKVFGALNISVEIGGKGEGIDERNLKRGEGCEGHRMQ